MFKNSLFLIFISLLFIFACSSDSTKNDVTKLDIPTNSIKALKGEVAFPDLFLAKPYRLLIIENNLLIVDPYEGKFLTLVDLDNPINTERLVHKGNGHNEMLNLRRVFFHEPNNALSLYDDDKRSIIMYKIEDYLINVESKSLLSSVSFKDYMLGSIIPFGNKYIRSGAFNNHQLSLYDKDGEPIQTFGTYPGNKEGIDRPTEFYLKTQGGLSVSPDQKHFAIAGTFNDQLAFYKATDTIPEKVKEYFSLDSKLETTVTQNGEWSNTRSNKTPETTEVYQALATTNKNLYVLHWGLTHEELESKSHDKTCTILVFDWNGNLTQAYDIPDFLSRAIAVDERNNCLYGITQAESGEMQIMRYQL